MKFAKLFDLITGEQVLVRTQDSKSTQEEIVAEVVWSCLIDGVYVDLGLGFGTFEKAEQAFEAATEEGAYQFVERIRSALHTVPDEGIDETFSRN